MGSLFGDLSQGDLIVAVLNFGGMFCSNFALKFIGFPVMVLAKSSKIIPVLFTGWFRGVYKITWAQVVISLTITSGLIIFSSNKFQGGFEG